MYRNHFYDLKVHFWWPNKRIKCDISSWHTLYNRGDTILYHSGRRPCQIRILMLAFFRLRAQFYMYKNTLDILQVFSYGWICLKLCFSSWKLNWFTKRRKSPIWKILKSHQHAIAIWSIKDLDTGLYFAINLVTF